MTLDVKAILERADRALREGVFVGSDFVDLSMADVPALCAEVERLRGEVAELTESNADLDSTCSSMVSARDLMIRDLRFDLKLMTQDRDSGNEALAASAEALRVEKLRHEGTMHVLLRKEAELKQARDWEDVSDEWSDAIHDAFPTKSGSHDEYGVAMQMVGHRHSKGELVALVNWLLVRLRVQDEQLAKVQETWSAVEVDNERLRAALHLCVQELENIGSYSGGAGNWPLQEALTAASKALAPTPTGGKEHE